MITRELVQKAYYRQGKPHTKTLQFSQRSKNAADKTRYGVKWQFLRHQSVDQGREYSKRYNDQRLHLSKLQEQTMKNFETQKYQLVRTLDSDTPQDIVNSIRDEMLSHQGSTIGARTGVPEPHSFEINPEIRSPRRVGSNFSLHADTSRSNLSQGRLVGQASGILLTLPKIKSRNLFKGGAMMLAPLTSNSKLGPTQLTFEEDIGSPIFPEIKKYSAEPSPHTVDKSIRKAFKASNLLSLKKIETQRQQSVHKHLKRKQKGRHNVPRPILLPESPTLAEIKIEDGASKLVNSQNLDEIRGQQESKEVKQAEVAEDLHKELNYNSAALSIPFDKTIVKHTDEDLNNYEVFDTGAHQQPPDAKNLSRRNQHFKLFKKQYDRNLKAVLRKCEEDDDLMIKEELLQFYSEQNKIRGEKRFPRSTRRSASPSISISIAPSPVHPVGGRLKLPSKQKMKLAKDGILRKADLGNASPLSFLTFKDSYEDTRMKDLDILERDQKWRARINNYGKWYINPTNFKNKLVNKPGDKHPEAVRAHREYQEYLMEVSREPAEDMF